MSRFKNALARVHPISGQILGYWPGMPDYLHQALREQERESNAEMWGARGRLTTQDLRNAWAAWPEEPPRHVSEGWFERALWPELFPVWHHYLAAQPGDTLREVNRARCWRIPIFERLGEVFARTTSPLEIVERMRPVRVIVRSHPEAEPTVDVLLGGLAVLGRPFTCPLSVPTRQELERFAKKPYERVRHLPGLKIVETVEPPAQRWGRPIVMEAFRAYKLKQAFKNEVLGIFPKKESNGYER